MITTQKAKALEVQIFAYENAQPEVPKLVDHWPSSGNAVDDEYQAEAEVQVLSSEDSARYYFWKVS